MTAALEAKDRNGGSQSQGQLLNQEQFFKHNFFLNHSPYSKVSVFKLESA